MTPELTDASTPIDRVRAIALLLPEASLMIAYQRAERILDTVRHMQIKHRGQTLGAITVSLGVAAFPKHGDTPEALIRAADQALYTAERMIKDAGDKIAIVDKNAIENAMGNDLKSLPWMTDDMDEMDQVFGPDPWPYGIKPNRPTLEALLQYTHEHGLTDRRMKIEDIFAPSTMRDIPLGDGQHV